MGFLLFRKMHIGTGQLQQPVTHSFAMGQKITDELNEKKIKELRKKKLKPNKLLKKHESVHKKLRRAQLSFQ